ncbi:MAG: hypothetical protein ACP5R5_04240 [Armatimonadota bacterium]
MKRLRLASTLLCSLALTVGLAWAAANDAQDTPKKIRIIYTNDTLGYLEPCG